MIGRDSYLFQRVGALLSQRRSQSIHIGMVLIVGFEEQHGTRAQRLRPLHIIPVFRMPFGLGKKLRRSGATHRMQLRFPALQTGFALFRIVTATRGNQGTGIVFFQLKSMSDHCR